MAIFSELPGLEVTVCLDDQPLWEYNDDDPGVGIGEFAHYQASKTVSKYVQSLTDQNFTVKLYVGPPYKFDCATLGFEVYVDGRKVKSPILQKQSYVAHTGWQNSVDGIKSTEVDARGRCQFHKFKFAKLETTIDEEELDDVKGDIRPTSEIGEIAVWVYRKSEAIKVEDTAIGEARAVDYSMKVHEKVLKGEVKSHGTVRGEARPARPSQKWCLEKIDGGAHPVAIYKFKYRSREALQSLLVIPRTPEPERPAAPTPRRASRVFTPLPSSAPSPVLSACSAMDVDSASPAEKLQLAAYLTVLRAGSQGPQTPEAGIKQENIGTVRTPAHGTKHENQGVFGSGSFMGITPTSTAAAGFKHERKEGGSASRKKARQDQDQDFAMTDFTGED